MKSAAAALTAATVVAAAAPVLAGPADLYYERSLMLAADARCDLFAPPLATALAAATAQARGAALRSGVGPASLGAVEARASARAASVGCGSPDLKLAAGRVRDAFEAWERTPRMTFPGAKAAWIADRTAYRSPAWRLSQQGAAGSAPVLFGVAGDQRGAALAAVAAFPAGQRPYAARIVLRDKAKAPNPWLDAPGARALPPRSASRVFFAGASAPAEATLTPKGGRDALAFRFPDAAADAIAGLDPREHFAVEFLFQGDVVRTARLEVGDFAAGRAFLALGQR